MNSKTSKSLLITLSILCIHIVLYQHYFAEDTFLEFMNKKGDCGITLISPLQERNQTFFDDEKLEFRRPSCYDPTEGILYPHPRRSGYTTKNDLDTLYFQEGYTYSYPDILIQKGRIFINPFKNVNMTDKYRVNPIHNIWSSKTTKNYPYGDQTPGSLFINIEDNNDERALAFSKQTATQHYFSTDFNGTDSKLYFCSATGPTEKACRNALLNFQANGNVGINTRADHEAKLHVEGEIQVEGPIFAKIGGIPNKQDDYVVFFNLYNFNINPNFWVDDKDAVDIDRTTEVPSLQDEQKHFYEQNYDPRGLAELGVIGIDFLKHTGPAGKLEDEIVTVSDDGEHVYRFLFRGDTRNLCRTHNNPGWNFKKQHQNVGLIYVDEADFVPWMCARSDDTNANNTNHPHTDTYWNTSSSNIGYKGMPGIGFTPGEDWKNPHIDGGAIGEPYAPKEYPYPWYFQKPFIIDHPLQKDHYLVHSALEGDEVAVFYRGKGRLKRGKGTVILPSYVKALTQHNDITIHLTTINSGEKLIVKKDKDDKQITENSFTVLSKYKRSRSEFYWEVKGKRRSDAELIVEPNRHDVIVKGKGPYRYMIQKKDSNQ